MERVLVTGAGDFIGHRLVISLKKQGCWVRGADIKYPEFSPAGADDFEVLNLRRLRRRDNCLKAKRGVDEAYALVADMGGMGFISANHSQILRNSLLVSIHTPRAAHVNGVSGHSCSSSACIYHE